MSKINWANPQYKEFKDTLSLWHIADFEHADISKDSQKELANIEGMINTNLELIKNAKSNVCSDKRTVADVKAENESFAQRYIDRQKYYKKLKDEQTDIMKKVEAMLDSKLMQAIDTWTKGVYTDKADEELQVAFAEWLQRQGITEATKDNVVYYTRQLGFKKGTISSKMKTSNHNAMWRDRDIRMLILGAICDDPCVKAVLPLKKWRNVIERKASNK